MKNLLFLIVALLTGGWLVAQNGAKKPASPPATVTKQIASGATITINYSQPSVKGRIIGKDLEPMDGKIWRAGANKATLFEVSKDVKVEGKPLAAGKYGLFALKNGQNWTFIFNKTWDIWGTEYEKNKADALRITVKETKAPAFSEALMYTIDDSGRVSLLWGDHKVDFKVK